MKVYYNVAPAEPFSFSGLLNSSQQEVLFEKMFNELAEKCFEHIALKFKYRVMWELRNLEDQIEEEGGMIIIEDSRWYAKNFSPELTEKIMEIFHSVNVEKW